MNASLYTVHFIGGPSDGLVLSDPHFNVRNKLQMPSSPAVVRCGRTHCYEFVGYWSSAYLLTSNHCTIEDGHPTTCLRYDFLGYELLPTQAERESPRQVAPRWLIGLGNWFSRVPGRFAKWMLEPIDHPLKVPGEQATFGRH
jgi:hypothetical protein